MELTGGEIQMDGTERGSTLGTQLRVGRAKKLVEPFDDPLLLASRKISGKRRIDLKRMDKDFGRFDLSLFFVLVNFHDADFRPVHTIQRVDIQTASHLEEPGDRQMLSG